MFVKKFDRPGVVLLGRHGDVILMLAAFKAIYDRTGLKPFCIVSHDYASVFDGVSYVEPVSIREHWWKGMPVARRFAKERFGGAIIPQWWNSGEGPGHKETGEFVLQCHGEKWGINLDQWPNFMASMWDRAGFTVEEMKTLPTVFDRRHYHREQMLVQNYTRQKKPLLLYNFTGVSSPYGFTPDVMPVLSRYQTHFTLVDIGRIKAHRIYDLLGLYDAAAGLITIDTATAHLANASNVPTVWYTVDGWNGSTPRGNVALHVSYNNTRNRIDDLVAVLEKWKSDSPVLKLPAIGQRNPTPNAGGSIHMAKPALAGMSS
jgi:hypothetical protein